MNLMQPVAGRPDQTNFTFCTHVNTGGIVPAWLMNVLITQDSVAFLERLGKEAQAQKGRAPKQKQQQPAFMTPAAVEHLVDGVDAGPPVVRLVEAARQNAFARRAARAAVASAALRSCESDVCASVRMRIKIRVILDPALESACR